MFIRNNFDSLMILFKRIKLKKFMKYEATKCYFMNIDL